MVACAVCGEENPERARFCLNCGTPLAAAGGREARKVVTVVFSGLAGSTSLGEEAVGRARELLEQTRGRHADALMTLAEVLRRAGRAAEATPALRDALGLSRQKGNTVLARRAQEALATSP